MCGRFTLKTPAPEIARLFDARLPAGGLDLGPRFNIAPTDAIVGVRRAESDGREVTLFHWGLIPGWVKDPKDWPTLINARAETLDRKPAFEEAFRFRRCLVVADGFYEWRREGGVKQPYYVRREDGKPLAFAGLWDRWRGSSDGDAPGPGGAGGGGAGAGPEAEAEGPAADVLESATIVTTDANEMLRRLHDRMPVILDREQVDRWLDPEVRDREPLASLLRPAPSEGLVAYPVSRRVSRPDTEGPDLIEPIEGRLDAGTRDGGNGDRDAGRPSSGRDADGGDADDGSAGAAGQPDAAVARPDGPAGSGADAEGERGEQLELL